MLTLTASARFLRTLKPQRFLASLPHVVEHDGKIVRIERREGELDDGLDGEDDDSSQYEYVDEEDHGSL